MNHCFTCGRTDTTEHTDTRGHAYWLCIKHQDVVVRDVEHYWDGFLGVNGNTHVPGCML